MFLPVSTTAWCARRKRWCCSTSAPIRAGLDCYLYPVQDMAAGSISVALGAGAHKAAFPAAVSAGDELALLASSRKCLLNGSPAEKRGFFQYTAAGDSKHPVTVEEHKSARLLFEFQEMQEGGDRF